MESDCGQKRRPGAAAHGPARSADRPSASQFTDIHPQDLQGATRVGSGGFGEVYRARHRVWRIPVAVKYMRVNRSNNHELLEEARKMHKAQFEYILRLYGITQYDLKPGIILLGLVTEFMENGSLEDLLHHYNVPLPLRLRFMYEIALGMNFLHNLNPALYHHDLKPANILLNKDYRIKICDFGLAKWRKLTSQNSGDSSKNHGTLNYMPPECFKDINARRDSKFDVYSYGIVIWEIITCQKPYENAVNSQHLKLCVGNGGRPDLKVIPKDFQESCATLINLMEKCWHENPNDRPPFSKCVHDLEPEQRSEEELRQAVQTLARQESTHVDGHREMSNGFYVNGSSELCEPVEEQNKNFNLAGPVQESVWKEGTAEVSHGASREEAVKSPVVTARECVELAELVNVKWKELARYLGLTNGEIEIIGYDYRDDGSTEQAYQVLLKWKQQQGQKASQAQLALSLSRIGVEHPWKR